MVNMLKKSFFSFLLLIFSTSSSFSAFHNLFEAEEDKEYKKEALKILSKKYRTLSQWFRCQRRKDEWIPFDDSLSHRASGLSFNYDCWLNELDKEKPQQHRIDEIKERIRIAREGDSLPIYYKELPICDVWEKNGPFKGYLVLKAYAKATRPTLSWPGNVFALSYAKTLHECKAEKYALLAKVSGRDETYKRNCLAVSRKQTELAKKIEQEIKDKDLPEHSPIMDRKKVSSKKTEAPEQVINLEEASDLVEVVTIGVPRSSLMDSVLMEPLGEESEVARDPFSNWTCESTQKGANTRRELRWSGEFDPPSVLTEGGGEEPVTSSRSGGNVPVPARKRTPRERSVNTPQTMGSKRYSEQDAEREMIALVNPYLSAEQQQAINMLINDAGMSEFEAYTLVLDGMK